MSSFDSENLFGSGKHKIEFVGTQVDSWLFAFPGIQGSFQANNGFRGRHGRITGTLRGADAAALGALEDIIIRYITDGTSATLEDNFGEEYPNVVLKDYMPAGPRAKTDQGEILQDYVVPFIQLKLES